MTTSEPNNPVPEVPKQPRRVERSRTDRVLGGVCAGIARSVGVDPVIVRLVAVIVGLFSAGAAVLAYLLAWVLLPQAAEEPQLQRPSDGSAPPPGGAKEAWSAVGGELKSLATELRPKQDPTGDAAAQPAAEPSSSGRSSARQSKDSTLTGLGDRLRAPEVQQGARRTLSGLSAAVDASVEELGSRVRRDRPKQEPSPAGGSDGPREQPDGSSGQ
jgi:phage shock protein PspC (stress-responsive transcriptional regulator)